MRLTNNKSILLYIAFALLFVACKNQKQVVSTPKIIEPVVVPVKLDNIMSEFLSLKYAHISTEKYIYISVKHQHLYLIENDSTLKSYPISTATNGIGNKANSNKTPYGMHTIKDKIGSEVPYAGILESRIYYGRNATVLTEKENADKDYVTTRIMWLQGEEQGLNKGSNVDSYSRYIYIHGTPEEGFIGQPASHGCIRMKNKDVIELFDLVDEGTPIYILEN
jgi:lipoprotein-anchoring transpeptidase ErfK/SrfK